MSALVGTYNPDDLTIIIGIETVDQFGDGNVVISRSNDVITPTSGFNGDVDLAVNKDKMGTITIPLKAHSLFNLVLTEWAAQTSLVPFPIAIRHDDTNVAMATTAWIQTQPDTSFGARAEDREWVLGLLNAETAVSATSISDLFSSAQ